MRLEDLTDYLRLRHFVSNPAEVVRFRKRQKGERDLVVSMRVQPDLHLRGGRSDFHMFHRIFLRDEYRLRPLERELGGRLGCIVDLGGNVGMFTARVARTADRVVTCEPVPENLRQLRRNVGDLPHVDVLEVAVTDQRGRMAMHSPVRDFMSGVWSRFDDRREWVSERTVEVDTVSLGDLFEEQGLDRVDLLKIDIEGGEYDALYPSEDCLHRVARIHGEYHDVRAEDPRTRIGNFAPWLRSQGFVVDVVPHPRFRNHGMFFARR